MAIIRVHKNPLKQAPEVFNVDTDVNLLQWLAESPFKSMGESGAVVSLNGKVIADSGKHDNLNERINVLISKHDQVDVIARAFHVLNCSFPPCSARLAKLPKKSAVAESVLMFVALLLLAS